LNAVEIRMLIPTLANISRRGNLHTARLAGVLGLALAWPGLAQDSPPAGRDTPARPATPSVDFARDVFPILKNHCLECHGEEEQEGDLRVDQPESLLTEDFVLPGIGEDSRLYEVLISEDEDRMPPPEEETVVPAGEIETIKAWIDQGAKWSDISALLPSDPAAASSDSQGGDTSSTGPATGIAPAKTSNVSRAEAEDFWRLLWRALGDFHPAVVHCPVAFLIFGGLFALFGLRGSYRCSDFAFYCLWIGALTAIAASAVGWSYAWNEGHNEDPFAFDMKARLFWHRWTGIGLSIGSFLLAVWATIARRRDPEDGTIWKLGLIVMAGLTMYVGHAGGDLTHPRGYRRLFELLGIQAPADVKRASENDLSNKPGQVK
jgi:uncharacterized membrane protein